MENKKYASMPPPTKKLHLNDNSSHVIVSNEVEEKENSFEDDYEEQEEEIDKDEILREILEVSLSPQ